MFIVSGLVFLAIAGGSMWLNYLFLSELWQLRLKDILSILENPASVDATRWSYLIAAALFAPIYLLLPSGKVATECDEDSLVLGGLVHPFTISNRIPGWCDTLRLDGTYNNREYDKHIEFCKDHPVGGAGLFKGAIFIGQQPSCSAGHNRGVFYLRR